MEKKRLLVLATGGRGENEGASGLQILHEAIRANPPILENTEIVAVVSKYQGGGAETKADRFLIPFEQMIPPFTAEKYQALVKKYDADHVTCSGWVDYVRGLDPRDTTNIHPGPTRSFGELGFYGKSVHKAVLEAYKRGEIIQTFVTMHFVIEDPEDGTDRKKGYDKGPEFFARPVIVREDDTVDILAKRVNTVEHAFQPFILNFVLQGKIIYRESEDGKNKRVAMTSDVFKILKPFLPNPEKIQLVS